MTQYRHVPARKDANVLTGAWCYDFKSNNKKSAMQYANNKFVKGGKVYEENGNSWKLIGKVQ